MNVEIRLFKKEDKEEIFNMMKEFYFSPAVIEKPDDEIIYTDIEECLNEDDLLLGYVVLVDNEIAGYFMLAKCYSTIIAAKCIWIEDIFIKKEYRNKKISNKIFNFIFDKYKGNKIRYKLEVEKENEIAYKTYLNNGFTISNYGVLIKDIDNK